MRRVALAALLLGTLAGCGSGAHAPGIATAGGAGTPAPTARPSSSTSRLEQARQFAQCMRDHGVDMPDPDPNGNIIKVVPSGITKQKATEATQACQQYLPPKALATPDAQQLAQLRDFAQCMRDHGIDMPDPDPNGGGLRIPKAAASGASDPAFTAALNACKDRLPNALKAGL